MTVRTAKVGDVVVEITCACGTQLVARWGEVDWSCSSCGHRGERGRRFRLLAEGWEPAEAPAEPPR